MNTLGLFVVGAFVTMIVLSAIGMLVYAAVMDGRHVRDEHERAEDRALREAQAAEAAEAASAV